MANQLECTLCASEMETASSLENPLVITVGEHYFFYGEVIGHDKRGQIILRDKSGLIVMIDPSSVPES